jgi:hypothetical protein
MRGFSVQCLLISGNVRMFSMYFAPYHFQILSLFYHCAVTVFFSFMNMNDIAIIYCSLCIYRKGYPCGMCYQLLKGIEIQYSAHIFFTKNMHFSVLC